MKMFASLSICLLIISCSMSEKEIFLPGKITVSNSDRTCIIYDSNKDVKFKLRDDKQFRYSGLKWMHKDDSFVGVEYLNTEKGLIYKGNLVRFDLTGKITERIYEAQDGELVGDTYLSRNDRRLMFILEIVGDIKINPLEGLNRQQSLVIMDFEQRKVFKRIENFGSSMSIDFEESPWLYDEDRLIYTVSSEKRIKVEGQDINSVAEGASGIYMYDLNTDQHKLLVPDGQFGICSPVNLQISYIKDKSVWVLDLKDNTTKMVYEAEEKQKVSNIHWTPDGKYIYLACFNNPGTDFFTTREKLIEVSTGEEIPFKKIGHGFIPYTWK